METFKTFILVGLKNDFLEGSGKPRSLFCSFLAHICFIVLLIFFSYSLIEFGVIVNVAYYLTL